MAKSGAKKVATATKTAKTKKTAPPKTKAAEPVKASVKASALKSPTLSAAPAAATAAKAKPTVSKPAAKKAAPAKAKTPSKAGGLLVDKKIKELRDWRGKTLAHMRSLIKEEAPTITETIKWGGVPVWEHDGIICTGETYKQVVKLTFAKGASLKDPSQLFNSSLDGNTRRSIDIREGDTVDETAFKNLVRAAILLNSSK